MASAEPAHREDYTATLREDGSWLVDGGLSIHEAEEMMGIHGMMDNTDSFITVAGFVLFQLGHVPKASEDLYWVKFQQRYVKSHSNTHPMPTHRRNTF